MNQAVLELTHGRNNPRNSEGAFVALKDGRIMYAYTRYYGKSWSDEATPSIVRPSTTGAVEMPNRSNRRAQ